MSDVRNADEPLLKSSADVEQCAADWLISQRDSSNWSAADQEALEGWLGMSLSHRIAYVRLQAAWSHADRLAVLHQAKSMRALSNQSRPALPRVVAAALAIALVGAAAVAVVTLKSADRMYSTPVGGHEVIVLADSSRIELNTNTVLRTRVSSGQRIVWLDKGEVLLQIKHDVARPFVVIAGDRRITDLGTEFTVRRNGGKLKVALLSGRAFIDRSDKVSAGSSAMLMPGDVAIATANSISITKVSAHDLADSLGWRSGTVVFSHTALADAIAEFNRYNRHKLVISDPVIGQLTIGGTFDVRNVEAFADIVTHAIGLKVSQRDRKTVFSR